MYLMNGGNNLRYKLLSVVWQSRIHHLVVDKETCKPYAPLCLFAANLAGKLAANSVKNYLRNSIILLCWAEDYGLDLEGQLRSGEPFRRKDILAYAQYLDGRRSSRGPLAPSYFNGVIMSAALLSAHFQTLFPATSPEESSHRERRMKREQENWRDMLRATPGDFYAQNLSSDQLFDVDEFLFPDNQVARGTDERVAVRNYLTWLYLREFGLRGGELLCLRLPDLLMTPSCWLRVPASNPDDPRNVYAPAAKTGARRLMLMDEFAGVEGWTARYLDDYRVPDEEGFFITSIRRQPLSIASLQKLAQLIQREVCDGFKWHRVRHTHAMEVLAVIVAESENTEHFRSLFKALEERMGWNNSRSAAPYLEAGMRELNAKRLKRLASW